MDSKLNELSIESKNTQNGARTRKLRQFEVGGLAETMQLGSSVEPTKLLLLHPKPGVSVDNPSTRGILVDAG